MGPGQEGQWAALPGRRGIEIKAANHYIIIVASSIRRMPFRERKQVLATLTSARARGARVSCGTSVFVVVIEIGEERARGERGEAPLPLRPR